MKKIISITLALIMVLGVMVAGVPKMTASAAGKAASVSLKSTAYNSNATVTIGWQKGSGGATGFQIAKKKLGDKKYKIMRSKGLGENTPDMMWETTMSPATRRLIKVMPEDKDATFKMFDVLLGDNLSGRKDFIAENGYKYIDLADIS